MLSDREITNLKSEFSRSDPLCCYPNVRLFPSQLPVHVGSGVHVVEWRSKFVSPAVQMIFWISRIKITILFWICEMNLFKFRWCRYVIGSIVNIRLILNECWIEEILETLITFPTHSNSVWSYFSMVLVSAEGSERRPPMEPPENPVLLPKQATWTKANDHMVFLDNPRIKSKYYLITILIAFLCFK